MRHDQHFHRKTWHGAHVQRSRRGRRNGLPVVPTLLAAAAAGLIGGLSYRPAPSTGAPVFATFTLCFSGGGTNCVVDGDTFWIAGEKVRIADIDTPETHPPRCAAEAELGDRATLRLQELLNAGPVRLAAADRAHDRYGRRLAVVMRDGRSLGETLVSEGLARPWEGRRRPWCGD